MKKINIEGMHCEGCKVRLTKVLNSLEGVKEAVVSLEEKNAQIDFDENIVTMDKIKETINDAGFEVVD